MARPNVSSTQRSKVRIFFVEADLGPGDMQELTTALTSAIRPAPISRPALTRSAAPSTSSHDEGQLEFDASVLADVEQAELDTDQVVSASRAPSRQRFYRKPVPVDMDMNAGGKAFEDFAKDKAPTSHRAKYLVAAAWLHDFAKVETITADHVFTCYKTADWTFDVADPSVTLRQLKKEGLGTMAKGSFSINHLGLSEVKKMNAQ